MTATAIAVLLATLVLGAVIGFLHLARSPRPLLVTAHLVLALAGLALVAALSLPAGRSGFWPLLLLTLALVAGWSARRIPRRSRRGAEILLIGHVALGVAGFLVFLAWAKGSS
jgi:hypothetical protein